MSESYTCQRCGEDFKRKDTLVVHLKRKHACRAILEDLDRSDLITALTTKQYNDKTFDCEYCHQKFNHCSAKSRHRKTCKSKETATQHQEATPSVSVDSPSIDTMSKDELVRQLEELKQKHENDVNELKREIAMMRAASKNTVITHNNTNNIYIQNIVNTFGNEDVSHLSKEFLSYCLMNPTKGLPSLIETIHYNPEKPCNHNIRNKSDKRNLYEKFIDTEWRVCDATNCLDELIRKGYKILNSHYTDMTNEDPSIMDDEVKLRMHEKFRFLSDKQSNEYYAVKRELRALVKDRTLYFLALPDASTSNDDMVADTDVTNSVD